MLKDLVLLSSILFMFIACQVDNTPTYNAPLLIDTYTKRINRYLKKSDDVWNHIHLSETGLQIFETAEHKKQKQAEFSLHWNDLATFQQLLEHQPNQAFQLFKQQVFKDPTKIHQQNIPVPTIDTFQYGKIDKVQPLKGVKIALDAGHIAGNLPLAELEGKNVQLTFKNGKKVKFYESNLTWHTARILQTKLEALGATVLMTRDDYDKTAFGQTYTEWYAKYDTTPKPRPQLLFHRYFKHEDNKQRIAKINAFKPHLTMILHYNVDANNRPWKRPTQQNKSMAFVGGSFMQGELYDPERRFSFLRLLLTEDIESSIELSKNVLNELNRQLDIQAISPKNDQKFLKRNSILTTTQGVYARNLALSSRIHGTLCYAEPLYQDNAKEARLLAKKDYEIDGRKVPNRIAEVAEVYKVAIVQYLEKAYSKSAN